MERASGTAQSRALCAVGAALLALAAAYVVRVTGGGLWTTTLLYGGAMLGIPVACALRDPAADPPGLRGRPGCGLAFLLSIATLPAFVLVAGLLGRPAQPLPALVDLGAIAFLQLFAVALPEEILFRAFLQRRLAAWRAAVGGGARNILGCRVGLEVPAAALLFALFHLPARGVAGLATFFPGLLFGWSYARTGNVWAGALYHAACNLVARWA
ncbi:MAG: CPBP family glutamic-type intramembrane protease [Planctomycetaceae bacterium]